MKYKVGDIVEFMDYDGAMKYGLIKDICMSFVYIESCDDAPYYISINNIHHRCNKYRVGQQLRRKDLALECIVTRVLLVNHRICYYVLAIGNDEEYFAFEDQLTIKPTNYGIARNDIDKVIFNDPATIIIWKDGTKTVVKTAPGETYNKWAGMALCISKKLYGDRFHRIFKEYCGEEEEKSSFSSWKEWHEALVEVCKNMGGKNNGEV